MYTLLRSYQIIIIMQVKDKTSVLFRLDPQTFQKMEEIRKRRGLTRDMYLTMRIQKDK